jgi:regulator of protease activity HflC (stomatin/prohibitin superfamily)
VIAAIVLLSGLKVLNEFERAVVFRLGRLNPFRGPGVIFVIPILERAVRIDLRTVTLDIPAQDVITRDNVTVKVSAVLYFRVIDPSRAVTEVRDYLYGTMQLAQTTLRSVGGQTELDDLLSQREKLNAKIQEVIDAQTEPWGIKVVLVELKNIDLPQDMQRAIAAQAEAERERRAKVIAAEGEFQAAQRRGRRDHGQESHHAAIALSPDARRNRDRAQFHHRLPGADRFVRAISADAARRCGHAGVIESRGDQARLKRGRSHARFVEWKFLLARGGVLAHPPRPVIRWIRRLDVLVVASRSRDGPGLAMASP